MEECENLILNNTNIQKDEHELRKERIEDAMISVAEDRAQEQLSLKGGASFHRGKSKQTYATPDDFMTALKERFGKIAVDLAADESNAKADFWFNEAQNSLLQPWHSFPGLQFLNPPYANIEPWAAKCKAESQLGAEILFLVPASVSTEWWYLHVHGVARVYFARPRLKFVGCEDPYPKDLCIARFGSLVNTGYECWKWK